MSVEFLTRLIHLRIIHAHCTHIIMILNLQSSSPNNSITFSSQQINWRSGGKYIYRSVRHYIIPTNRVDQGSALSFVKCFYTSKEKIQCSSSGTPYIITEYITENSLHFACLGPPIFGITLDSWLKTLSPLLAAILMCSLYRRSLSITIL